MRMLKAMAAAGALWALMAGSVGCKGLEEYNALEAQCRRANAEREKLAADLNDEKIKSQALEQQLAAAQREAAMKDEVISKYRADNEALKTAFDNLQRVHEELVAKLARFQKPIVVTRQLPPELDRALKDFAAANSGVVEYDPAKGMLKWKSDLLFAPGSDVVAQAAAKALAGLAEIILSPAAADFDVIVVGHTDDIPIKKPETRKNHPTNWHLSVHRAIAVMKVLRTADVPEQRMGVMGYGEFRPVAPNAPGNKGNPLNRRVEIYIQARRPIEPEAAGPDTGDIEVPE